ncbi:hypothetical protein J4481_02575 [Candidatus Pacearchaeota archaeon]|nr:hypothetical protein [Candidatus Pacearchaeota archaeon]
MTIAKNKTGKVRKSKAQPKKATIVITYNSVENFPAGTYEGKNGPVIIYSNDNTYTWSREAENKLGQVLHQIYGKTDEKDVGKVYLYVGSYAKEGALRAARKYSDAGKNLTLVACSCDSGLKERTAQEIGAPIIWSECGGRRKLSEIVKGLM